jgi:hypothetical protein
LTLQELGAGGTSAVIGGRIVPTAGSWGGGFVKKLMFVPVLAVVAVGGAQAATHTGSVKATEVEFHIKSSAPSGKAGKISFAVKNAGL